MDLGALPAWEAVYGIDEFLRKADSCDCRQCEQRSARQARKCAQFWMASTVRDTPLAAGFALASEWHCQREGRSWN